MNSDDEQLLGGGVYGQDEDPTLAHGPAALTTGTRRSVGRDQAGPGG
ncbi:hypothetical protein PV367_02260 [Streptomyces europaeiscabiei]|uniref:Uncharacterized protein n=1 Tax=Streptomyces europaeiscabiei TaxID=146819 RepID=A0AAJ2PKF7_9ACTN|nr:hypothetical protein [Streptomyces europaeiscabiei]MDX3128646.1 hypothetical protein [Streptomyces europaeiscabiei]